MSHTNSQNENKVACREMCFYCFDVLSFFFDKKKIFEPSFPNDKYPIFVTWKIGGAKRLRGCIGTFEPISLHNGLKEYALTSALKDSRFEPISKEELPQLHVGISLLLDFENAENYLDWEIGTHGIIIKFLSNSGRKLNATYLPEVASEQGWNKLETIDSLIRKAGYSGSITDDLRKSIKLTRYQSEKVNVSYKEYKDDWLNRK